MDQCSIPVYLRNDMTDRKKVSLWLESPGRVAPPHLSDGSCARHVHSSTVSPFFLCQINRSRGSAHLQLLSLSSSDISDCRPVMTSATRIRESVLCADRLWVVSSKRMNLPLAEGIVGERRGDSRTFLETKSVIWKKV